MGILKADRIITEQTVVKNNSVIDGHGETWTVAEGWDYSPIVIKGSGDVMLKNINIVASKDACTRLHGMVWIEDAYDVILDNVTLECSGEPGGTPGPVPLMVRKSKDITVKNCDISYSPLGHNVDLQDTLRVKLIDNNIHHAYYDGVKVGKANYSFLLQGNHCHHNGMTPSDGVAAGDGIDLTHGSCGGDLISNICEFNDNGITFKYANWNEAIHGGSREGCYGVNIIGGSLKYNGNGLFAQGYSGGSGSNTGNEFNSPYPMGFNVSGVLSEDNENHGFIVGDGSWNFDNCTAYKNGGHGMYLTENARGCIVRNLMSVANTESNLNVWGPNNDIYNAKCYGVDVFQIPYSRWRNSDPTPVTGYGINHQWKPVRQKNHGVYTRCVNEFSEKSNGKPQHLPDKCWIPFE